MKDTTRAYWAQALRSGAIMAAFIISVVALLIVTNVFSFIGGALTCEDIPSLRTEVFNWTSYPDEDSYSRFGDSPASSL